MPIPLLLLSLALMAAQAAPGAMRARLSPVPLDVAMQETIAGQGTATAALAGTTLTVNGSYAGLKSAATAIRVFESAKPGLRGPQVGEFASGGGTSGTFKGTLTLTREQAAAFAKGLLYVQLHSEGAPDGNLWGWLLPAKGRQ